MKSLIEEENTFYKKASEILASRFVALKLRWPLYIKIML